jgi:hypothetical protein
VWVKDAGQTLLVDRETGQSWLLYDAEAMIWDLLIVGYPYEKIIQMISLVLSLSEERAEHTLSGVLRTWQKAGIIHPPG